MSDPKIVGVLMPLDLIDEIDAVAARDMESRAAVIRRAIREYLERVREAEASKASHHRS